MQPREPARGERDRDVTRVTNELSDRLHRSGIEVYDSDTSTDVVMLVEALEAFEKVVVARGGDLMVDEPPAGSPGQPDAPEFRLPVRAADESAFAYAVRLTTVTEKARHARR